MLRGPGAGFGPAGEVDWVAGRRGKEGAGWAAGLGSLFLFLSSFLPLFFFFWFSNFTQTIEFKHEFEFNPSTQTNKIMHQHECTNNFKPRESFNYSWKKIKLNARLSI